MSEEEITEGNRLIAEFMNTQCEMNVGEGYRFPIPITLGDFDTLWQKDLGWANELIYHESWDWLMPVVIKIIADYRTDFFIDRMTHDNFYSAVGTDGNYQQGNRNDNPLESVFINVVNFVKWHNAKKL